MSGKRIPITINGTNPYWLIDAAETLFDQSELYPDERFMPMLRFQRTIMIMVALYRFVTVSAPSQSGKTTVAEVLAAVLSYALPGSKGLILSTIQEQSDRVLSDIRDKLIKQHRVPELRVLDIDNKEMIRIKETRSQIKALPHSIKAVTGNPADWIICDEMEKWDKEPEKVYAEVIARTGKTGGIVLIISSVDQEGKPDANSPNGYLGSFFYHTFAQEFKNRKSKTKSTIAARFTYHVSPFLIKNIEEIREKLKDLPEYFKAHYLGIPRKAKGKAIFHGFFNRVLHIKSELDLPLNPNEPLALCFDPGLNKAAVLLQLDPDAPRLIYLRAYIADRTVLFDDFVKSTVIKIRKAFPHFEIQYFADIAAKKENDLIADNHADVIARITGQYPIMQYQLIAPGIQIMKSFMKRVDGFFVSDQCDLLPDAFESGAVAREVNGVPQEEYVKDGYWEHILDASRYSVVYLTGGYSADALTTSYSYELSYNQNVNPITGY